MFLNRVDCPQFQPSGAQESCTAENQKRMVNELRGPKGRRKDNGWKECEGGSEGERREIKAGL